VPSPARCKSIKRVGEPGNTSDRREGLTRPPAKDEIRNQGRDGEQEGETIKLSSKKKTPRNRAKKKIGAPAKQKKNKKGRGSDNS